MNQCYQVTYDSGGISPDCFVVHKSDTMKHYFCESKEGLFYLDLQVDLNTVAFVMTVEDMESLYINHGVRNTKATRKLQCIIGWPNSQYLQHLIQNNLLPGRNLTSNDVKIADHIYGCDLRSIKGKPSDLHLNRLKYPYPVSHLKLCQNVNVSSLLLM